MFIYSGNEQFQWKKEHMNILKWKEGQINYDEVSNWNHTHFETILVQIHHNNVNGEFFIYYIETQNIRYG